MNECWPFDQPPNCAVFSLRSIADGREPILHVSHDGVDHGWQFLGWERPSSEELIIISLEEALRLDPTLLELATLPPGWHAWRRSIREPWTCEPYSDEE